jgi:hypothetical protein
MHVVENQKKSFSACVFFLFFGLVVGEKGRKSSDFGALISSTRDRKSEKKRNQTWS